jgi:hypothetical protein
LAEPITPVVGADVGVDRHLRDELTSTGDERDVEEVLVELRVVLQLALDSVHERLVIVTEGRLHTRRQMRVRGRMRVTLLLLLVLLPLLLRL